MIWKAGKKESEVSGRRAETSRAGPIAYKAGRLGTLSRLMPEVEHDMRDLTTLGKMSLPVRQPKTPDAICETGNRQ